MTTRWSHHETILALAFVAVPACASEVPEGDAAPETEETGSTTDESDDAVVMEGGTSSDGSTATTGETEDTASGSDATSGDPSSGGVSDEGSNEGGDTTTGEDVTPPPSCDGVFPAMDICGSCLETTCCEEVFVCLEEDACVQCLTDESASGCESVPSYLDVYECAYDGCSAQCFDEDPNPDSCMGPASTVGEVDGYEPDSNIGYVLPDDAGNIRVILQPDASLDTGELVVGVFFFAQPGQYSYPSGSNGCALLQATADSFTVIDTTQLCDVQLDMLEFASAVAVCDGAIAGTFTALFSGNQALAGTFNLPMNIHESEVSGPSCQPTDGPCTTDDQCCSQSCSPFLGVCY